MIRKQLISVCIPVYNCEKYIGIAIESVLNQTYTDLEIIIVDNHSTDKTWEIINTFAKNDQRISVYQNDSNLGMVGNWNRVVSFAQGKYIKMLNSDDTLEPESIETFVRILDEHPKVSLVTSFEQFIGDRHDVRKMPNFPAIYELNGRTVQKHLFQFGNWIGCPTAIMLRRKDLGTKPFNPLWKSWMLDLDMWFKLLAVGNLYVVPKILSHTRIHNQQCTAIGNKHFTFITEEMLFIQNALKNPDIYGNFSREEKNITYKRILTTLIQDTLRKKRFSYLKNCLSIGHKFAGLLFWKEFFLQSSLSLLNNQWTQRIRQIFPKRQSWKFNNFFWRRKFYYKKDPKIVDTGWSKSHTSGNIQVPLDILRANIWETSGLRSMIISETPHYQWIKDLVNKEDDTSSYQQYRRYIEIYFPELEAEMQLNKVRELVRSFQSQEKPITISIVTNMPMKMGDYFVEIVDGVHRTAIAKAFGHESIICQLLYNRSTMKNNLAGDLLKI